MSDKTALGELAVKTLGPSAERLRKTLESAVETFICNPLDNWIQRCGERITIKSKIAKEKIIEKIEKIPEENRKDQDLSIVVIPSVIPNSILQLNPVYMGKLKSSFISPTKFLNPD